ncbi:DNA-3-methyladenine glycosylase I [Streptomyces sp. NPDC049954]|uniref:DNA-3-methyladenine glycosylase I n=1 Tax=Streptomyces sp. NPDC049954 TaxID=3155779 RepID=UPI003447EE5A
MSGAGAGRVAATGAAPLEPPPGAGRCGWASGTSELMTAYHDREWGRPAHDDAYLFELLVLEGAQAGLSWSTVLNKRENYRRLLDGFDVRRVAEYGQPKLDALLTDPGIVRNRLKVASLVKNARAFLAVREERGSFDAYLWQWVGGRPVVNTRASGTFPPARTELSDRISKDLKKRGFTFVGTTITYAFLQAVGVVDDHAEDCWVRRGN